MEDKVTARRHALRSSEVSNIETSDQKQCPARDVLHAFYRTEQYANVHYLHCGKLSCKENFNRDEQMITILEATETHK